VAPTGLLLNVDVPELARGVDFYTRALDLEVARRLGDDIVELRGAVLAVFLLERPAGTKPAPAAGAPRDYARHWTPVHFDVVVEAVEPALERAVSAGAICEGGVQEYDWGRMAVLADPFGHGFCLLQFVGRGYDGLAERYERSPRATAITALPTSASQPGQSPTWA
jgi:predicted enzyme related to lactoylglutathione lyase